MSSDGCANHICQKLKLAVAIAIIQTKPDNLTIAEHIDEIKSNICNKMDTDFDLSVCSDDFNLDFDESSQKENNNDENSVNNNSSIIDNNNIIEDHNNDNLTMIVKETMINNSTTNIINNSVNEIDNRKAETVDNNSLINKNNTNDCQLSKKIDVKTKINNSQSIIEEVTNKTENNKSTNNIINNNDTGNELLNINSENAQDYYDIIFNHDNLIMINSEIEEFNNSPTLLQDFELIVKENVIENSIKFGEDAIISQNDIHVSEKNISQDIFIASQNIDLTQYSNFTYCETIDNIDLTTQENIPRDETFNTNKNKEFVKVISNKNNLKHTINLEDDKTNPKKKRNVEKGTITPNIDPNKKFRSNITKYLQNNMAATNTENIADKSDISNKTPVEISLENVKMNIKETNKVEIIESTQNTSHYSQSQPLFLIDRKYIYENRKQGFNNQNNIIKKAEQTENNLNPTSKNKEVTKAIYSKVNAELKQADRQNKPTIHNNKEGNIVQERDANIKDIVQEKETNKTRKVFNNNIDLNVQGEIYLFSQNISNESEVPHFEHNHTNIDKTQEYYNNFINKNNLKPNIEINSKYNTKDIKNNILSRRDENSFKNQEKCHDLNTNALKENEIINLNNNSVTKKDTNNNKQINKNYTKEIKNNIPSRIDENSLETRENIHDLNTNLREKENLNNNSATNIDTTDNKPISNVLKTNENQLETKVIKNIKEQSLTENINNPYDIFSQDIQLIERQNSNPSDTENENELIPFKIIEEMNKIRVYLNKLDSKSTDGSLSDAGYKSDSQSRHSFKSSQSHVWLNQSAHCLFIYITTCPIIHNTQDITRDISQVLGQLIDKLHENEQYPPFLEELLETIELLIKLIYEDNFEENQLLKRDENVERIFLLTKSTHIQKYTIEKITTTLQNLLQILSSKDSIQEIQNIQKIENSCYLFHILHLTLQKYYKNQLSSQKNQNSSKLYEFSSQKNQNSSHKSLNSSQLSSQNSQNSQIIRKTDISDIWRRKWNPNLKEITSQDGVERKCILTECNKVLNNLIVNCMDGYSLIAYFALKCFNLMQS